MSTRGILTSLALAALLVGVAGCSHLTRKNFDKVQDGMTLEQVEKLLGKEASGGPSSAMPGATEVMTWQQPKPLTSVSVGFKEGRVVGKTAAGL
jgi:hypothetical protein